MSKTEKTQPTAINRPSLPIQFDPHFYKAVTCEKGCADTAPCKHPIHGGWRLSRLLHAVPQAEWTRAMQTAVCWVCHCPAGTQACEECLCHIVPVAKGED